MNGSIQYVFFAVCLRFFEGFSGREKGLRGLLPLISGSPPSRPPASHPFLSWRPSSCPETAEAPVEITVRKVGGWPRGPCLGRHRFRPDPEAGDGRPGGDSGEAGPHPASRSGCPESPRLEPQGGGSRPGLQPALGGATGPSRLPAAVPGTGGPGGPRPPAVSGPCPPQVGEDLQCPGPCLVSLTQGQCL